MLDKYPSVHHTLLFILFFFVENMQEHSPPSTQAIEQVCLSPAVTPSNQNSTVSFTFTLSSSNFYQPDLSSSAPSIHITPTPLITQPPIQPSSAAPFPAITHSVTRTLAPSTVACTPLVQPAGGGINTAHKTVSMESEGDPASVVRDIVLNSHDCDEQREISASSAPQPPAVRRGTAQKEVHNTQSQNVNSDTVHNDGNEVAPGNQLALHGESVLKDTYCDDPGNIDNTNDSSSGSDSDSVIVLQESNPATTRKQLSQPAQLDSSEDFQESPLPRTPKRTPAKRSTPQSHAKKPASGVAARKRGLSSATSKESPQSRAPVAKKVIVTRSMTSTRGNKSSVENSASTRPARQFYSWRTTAVAAAKGNRPPQPNSTTTAKHGQITKPARKATSSDTTSTKTMVPGASTSTRAAKASSAGNVQQTPATTSTEPAAVMKPTVASTKSTTATVPTAPAAKHALTARPSTPTSTKPTCNASTKSTLNSSKPSRPTSATSAKPTTSTRSALSSKPPSKAVTKDNSSTKNSKGNSISRVTTASQSRNANKSQLKGTKRRLAVEDSDEAQADAASSRKKARSFERGSPGKDGVSSEIALHTRGL